MAKSFLSGENNKKKRDGRKLPLKKIAIVAGVMLAAFGLGLAAFLLQQGTPQQDQQQPEETVSERQPEGAVEESIAQIRDGDYAGAQQRLEEELKSTDDDERAHRLLIQQAVNAFNEEKYDDSLAFAREAIERIDNYQANSMAAQAAEAAEDFAAAEQYYRATLAKLDKDNPLYESEKENLEESIKRVSQ